MTDEGTVEIEITVQLPGREGGEEGRIEGQDRSSSQHDLGNNHSSPFHTLCQQTLNWNAQGSYGPLSHSCAGKKRLVRIKFGIPLDFPGTQQIYEQAVAHNLRPIL